MRRVFLLLAVTALLPTTLLLGNSPAQAATVDVQTLLGGQLVET